MKNLKLLNHKTKSFNIGNDGQFLVANSDNRNISFLWSNQQVCKLNLENGIVEQLFSLFNVVAMEYLTLNNQICIATREGEVIVYNLENAEQEVVSFCEAGIECMDWSPDQEVAVFVTRRSQNVVIMSCQYDPIGETPLKYSSFGDQEFVTVGWGKKETQFHGSEGKDAAKQTEAILIPKNHDEMDKNIQITWRSDGQYFAVGFLDCFGRSFKIFNKEGILQYTGEKMAGLETPIAWRPSGLWIAVPHLKTDDSYVISLFEKNGLKHREIMLPFKNKEQVVISLNWSNDSEILIVEVEKRQQRTSCLYIYTIGNYHWYVKQYIEYENRIISQKWDSNYSEGKTLHVLLDTGVYHMYRLEFAVDCSTGQSTNDEAIVGVIDDKSVMLTNFRATIIPPPMCGYSLSTQSNINTIGFLKNSTTDFSSNLFFLVDSNWNIKFYRPKFVEGELTKRLIGADLIGKLNDTIPGSHYLWVNSTTMVYSINNDVINIMDLNLISTEHNNKVNREVKVAMTKSIMSIESFDPTHALIQDELGNIYKLDTISGAISFYLKLPEFCEQITAVDTGENDTKIISLKNRQFLYVNEEKIQSDVTSYFLTGKFLTFTTISSLKFMELKSMNKILDERRIERGSKLIIIVPKDSKTVFQLPRGNLEAIHPRLLSLCIIGDFLDRLEFSKAFDILRKQRINLNLLVDHNPILFIDNIRKFILDIDNPNWLNLFLTDLQNQNVCNTMYMGNYPNYRNMQANNCGFELDAKISFICDKTLEVLNDLLILNKDYILPIITCYVKKNLLEDALGIIWQMKHKENDTLGAENALKYLLYLVDVNVLYNVALGMYDFELVLFVASKSQKDPKEYIPFLNELKRIEVNYQHFKIDCHLKKFGKAIEHMAMYEGDDYEEKFQECLEIITSHNLFTKAMQCYSQNKICFQQICLKFADNLRTKNKLIDASMMYERAGDYQQALSSARNALDWERCLKMAKLNGNTMEEISKLSLALLPALMENNRHKEAAYMLKFNNHSTQLIVDTLLKGKLYSEAILEASFNQIDLIKSLIKPNLQEYLDLLIMHVEEDCNLFQKYKARLKVVRKLKEKRRMEPDNEEEHDDDWDLYSDSIVSSNRSGKSHKSSKNRRKHERKLLSLKEGNQFEDLALIDAIYSLIIRVYNNNSINHIRDICKVAVELKCDGSGALLQNHFSHLLYVIKNSLDEIWILEMIDKQEIHYSLLKPCQRYKPEIQDPRADWQFDCLELRRQL